MSSWHDDPTFWEDFREAIFHPGRLAAAPEEVDRVLALAEVDGAVDVLDMPCGVGRHALELAHRGHRVTGVDLDARALERARARPGGDRVEWVRADMRRFRREAAYDLAINLFTSLGYFDDPDDDARVLANLRDALRPGGRLVVDVAGRECLLLAWSPARVTRLGDDRLLVEETRPIEDWARVESRWTLVEGDRVRRGRLVLRLYTAQVLRGLLLRLGFEEARCYGGLDGRPYDEGARRLVVVARKGEPAR